MTDIDLNKARKAYNQQHASCKHRRDHSGNQIQFLLTFDEWLDIWQKSGKWAERGRGWNSYVMSRFNDLGNYEVGNVFIQKFGSNLRDSYKRAAESLRGRAMSEEAKRNLSISTTGKMQSKIWNDNIAAGLRNRPGTRCPSCGRVSNWCGWVARHIPTCKA